MHQARASHSLLPLLLVTLCSLILYLPWLSIQYNPNGINEAVAVEKGGAALFSPNHMLYRPVGALLRSGIARLGWSVRAVHVLQVVTAICAALATGIAFLAFRQMTGHLAAALVATALLATSSYYWACSVDAFYINPAALCAAGALLAITASGPLALRSALGAIACALAILTWQANILLIPGLGCAIACSRRGEPARARLLAAALFACLALALTGATYLAVGWLALGERSPAALVEWPLHYSGGDLPQWGRWGLDRVPTAASSQLSSLVPVTPGLSLRRLAHRPPDAAGLMTRLSVAALAVLLGVAAWNLLARPGRSARLRQLGWLALTYATLVTFVVWWDPFEPKWFVVPNLFLAALLANAWAAGSRPRVTIPIIAACVLTIAAATFVIRIWPKRMHESREMRNAACVASHMKESDLFFAVDWKWIAYMRYFHDREAVSVIGLAAPTRGAEEALQSLGHRLEATHTRGADVYMIDPDVYSPGFFAWFTSQTGLSRADLSRIEGEDAFTCDDLKFLRVRTIRQERAVPR